MLMLLPPFMFNKLSLTRKGDMTVHDCAYKQEESSPVRQMRALQPQFALHPS
jgi:hypothetical protein